MIIKRKILDSERKTGIYGFVDEEEEGIFHSQYDDEGHLLSEVRTVCLTQTKKQPLDCDTVKEFFEIMHLKYGFMPTNNINLECYKSEYREFIKKLEKENDLYTNGYDTNIEFNNISNKFEFKDCFFGEYLMDFDNKYRESQLLKKEYSDLIDDEKEFLKNRGELLELMKKRDEIL